MGHYTYKVFFNERRTLAPKRWSEKAFVTGKKYILTVAWVWFVCTFCPCKGNIRANGLKYIFAVSSFPKHCDMFVVEVYCSFVSWPPLIFTICFANSVRTLFWTNCMSINVLNLWAQPGEARSWTTKPFLINQLSECVNLFLPWLTGAAKPKRFEMVLPVMKQTMWHRFRAL